MNIFALSALSFSMSLDAFTASVVRGSNDKNTAKGLPKLLYALKIGLIFGVIEAITPIIGYFIGELARGVVQTFDHWVSFVLLSGLGIHLIYEALHPDDADDTPTPATSWIKTLLTAFATSIDAMIVGVSLAFLEVNIWLASAMIGIFTTIMATLGVYFGSKLGEKFGHKAQIFGGVVLMLIGLFILLTHLHIL